MHDHRPKVNVFAIIDTFLASGVLIWLLSTHLEVGLIILASSVLYTHTVVSHYRTQGLSIGIRELVYFYIEIPFWKVVSGRVAHDRIHPKHQDGANCPCCGHDVRPVRSLGELIIFQIIGLPMLSSVILLKASAVFFAPLLYVGFAFHASNYQELEFDARKRYRSSFKQIWLVVALMGIGFFVGKIFLYTVWYEIADWWNSQSLLAFLTPLIYPSAFLPFHLTGALSATLLLVGLALVDRSMHYMDDRSLTPENMPKLLRSIRIVGRTRLILSFYTWACMIWIAIPWLRTINFPPVSMEIIPK